MYRIMVSFFLLILSFLSRAQEKLPNILFILADDLGYADLGCYNNPYIRTPNIDKLAKMGMRFTQAYTASPICSPSRAAIMTGQHPGRLKLTNFLEGVRTDSASPLLPAEFIRSLPASTTTIAEILRSRGYYTGLIGKWHLGGADSSQPNKHGFDYERVARNRIFYYDFALTSQNKVTDTSVYNENLTDKLTDEAIRFLKIKRNQPFFLYLSQFAPHLVLQPKPQKLPYYYFNHERLSKGRYDPQYAATLETLDDNIGRLMQTLTEQGLWENTIIVFTSDNGGVHVRELGVKPTDNSPLREGKSHMYEGGIRIPLLMVWKDHLPEASINNEMVVNTDFYHSFAAIAGVKTDQSNGDGKLIRALFPDQSFITKPGYWWYYPHFSNQQGRPAASIREGDMKLIVHLETGKKELYNIAGDISEKNDLALRLPGMVETLMTKLTEKMEEARVNRPRPNPAYKK